MLRKGFHHRQHGSHTTSPTWFPHCVTHMVPTLRHLHGSHIAPHTWFPHCVTHMVPTLRHPHVPHIVRHLHGSHIASLTWFPRCVNHTFLTLCVTHTFLGMCVTHTFLSTSERSDLMCLASKRITNEWVPDAEGTYFIHCSAVCSYEGRNRSNIYPHNTAPTKLVQFKK